MNVGESVRQYDAQGAAINDSLSIIGPDGRPVPYTAGDHQTAGNPRPIRPGETAVLIPAMDIWSQYFIHEPGAHMVRFRGLGNPCGDAPIPPSNSVALEVLPSGSEIASNSVYGRLLRIVPGRWKLSMWPRTKGLTAEVTPHGRTRAKGYHFMLTTLVPEGFVDKGDLVRVSVWLVDRELELSPQADGSASAHLGRSRWGEVYAQIPEAAERLWPGLRSGLADALTLPRGK
jgi:hypothetical protein